MIIRVMQTHAIFPVFFPLRNMFLFPTTSASINENDICLYLHTCVSMRAMKDDLAAFNIYICNMIIIPNELHVNLSWKNKVLIFQSSAVNELSNGREKFSYIFVRFFMNFIRLTAQSELLEFVSLWCVICTYKLIKVYNKSTDFSIWFPPSFFPHKTLAQTCNTHTELYKREVHHI